MLLIRLTFFILILNAISVSGQSDPCHKSTEGTDFRFGFMENAAIDGHYVDITITSVYKCKYDIYIGKSTTPVSGILNPNTPKRITFDWNQVEAIGSETIQDKAIHLVSDNLLNVFALNWTPASADAALIFPTESLGKEYYAMCYAPHIEDWAASEFLIVASEDNTNVEITPSKVTGKGKLANTTYSITLQKGELYQVQSSTTRDCDLTGSYIKSDKPIAFYSGSLVTTIPDGISVCCADHLYEQIPPLQTWGRKFIAVPLKSREKDTYRILAAEDNTTVRVGNKVPVLLDKGQYYEFMLMWTEPSLIESSKPVLLAQYSNSQSVDALFTNNEGDPFMVIVSPVNQTREKVTFVAYDSQQIKDKYFVNIVVKNDAVGKINLDNVPITFLPLDGTGYSYAQVKITKGNHILESTEPGKGFIAYVYGFGEYESYGYGVGYNLDIVLDLGSNINANGKRLLVRCDGAEPLTLNAGNGFDNYKWSTGETTPLIKIATNGWYKVEVSTNDGCMLKDSVELQVDGPKINLGSDTTICNPATIVLNAGDQSTYYLWSTTQTDQKITVSKPGIYFAEAINKYGCKTRDSIQVSYTSNPKMNLSRLDTLICGKKSDILDVTSDKGKFTIERLSDGFISNGKEVTVPDFGTYNLKIKATDEFSCYSDSIVRFGFRKTPKVDFSVDSIKCYGYNLDVKYLGDATIDASEFVWIFGGDTIKRGVGINSYIFPLGINRDRRDLKLKVTEQGCSNEKTLRDIKVIPNLHMQVENRFGCEPFTTKFVANNTETVTYDWDFGDKNVLSGSTADPSHTYQNEGYYSVKLKVTTDKGCNNEVRIDSMICTYPMPTAAFSMDNKIVYNDAPTVNFLDESSGANTYSWDFGDGSTSDLKNPSHYFKVTGYRTVRMEAFNEFFCSDTVSHKLLVAFDRIFPPNAFSPNAANLVDREYKLGSNGIATEGYHLTILSRWDDIVFEAKGEIKGWNGQTPNGSMAPAGIYVWVLDFYDFLGRRHRQTGTVTVVY